MSHVWRILIFWSNPITPLPERLFIWHTFHSCIRQLSYTRVISTRVTRFINFPSVISPCYPTQWSISATSALLPQYMQSTISLAACSFHQRFLKYPRPSLNSRAFVGNILQIKCKCAFLDIALILNEMNINGLDGLEFFHFLYMIKWWSWFYKVFGKVCLLLLHISFSNFRAVCAKFHILFFPTYPLQIQ